MASHYIVSQQRRMNGSGGSSCAATPTSLAAAGLRDGLSLTACNGTGGVVAAAMAAAQQQQQARPAQQQGAPAQQQAAPAGERRAPALLRWHDQAAGVLGCKHYKRRCMLVAPCCDTPHVCRLCHDEASDHQVCIEVGRDSMHQVCTVQYST